MLELAIAAAVTLPLELAMLRYLERPKTPKLESREALRLIAMHLASLNRLHFR